MTSIFRRKRDEKRLSPARQPKVLRRIESIVSIDQTDFQSKEWKKVSSHTKKENAEQNKSNDIVDTKCFSPFNTKKVKQNNLSKKPVIRRSSTFRLAQYRRRSLYSAETFKRETEIIESEWVTVVRLNVIGRRCLMSTPFGKQEMVYADYTASGRSLKFIEEFMVKVVAPTYGNTHTESSMTGAQTSRLREESRNIIHEAVHAPKEDYSVLFTGSGATGAIDKLVAVLGLRVPEYLEKKYDVTRKVIPKNKRPVVFISHFEHHSNELIWRESIAECVVVREGEDGTPDLLDLEEKLCQYATRKVPLIGSFSAGSNVTGITSNVHGITELLHRFGAYSFFDYAGTGAYVNIDMSCNGSDETIDAIFVSPHKFAGGPGSAGVLVARRKLFNNAFGIETTIPSTPGGGTVSYVSRHDQSYSKTPEHREDAGTPGILQSIRSGLVFHIKELVGCEMIKQLEYEHISAALSTWSKHPMISLVGSDRDAYGNMTRRVSIFSFNILSRHVVRGDAKDSIKMVFAKNMKKSALANVSPTAPTVPLHYNFVVAILNDVYGIQGRGGCSCAGPYGYDLLGLSPGKIDDSLKQLVGQGYEVFKPGWARVNFNYFIGKMEADFIIKAIEQIATHGWKILPLYIIDSKTAQFVHRSRVNICSPAPYSVYDVSAFANGKIFKPNFAPPKSLNGERVKSDYNRVLQKAMRIYNQEIKHSDDLLDFTTSFPDSVNLKDIWWLLPSDVGKSGKDGVNLG